MTMIITGIDPGITGALAKYRNNLLVDYIPMPMIKKEIDMFKIKNFLVGSNYIFLEKAQSMPRQGISSAFNYGRGYGELIGCIKTLGLPFTLVHPKRWQKISFNGTNTKADPKDRASAAALRLAPQIFKEKYSKKTLIGIIDAVLIAYYGVNQYVHK